MLAPWGRVPAPRPWFGFPRLWGLPLAFGGRGAARCGGYRFCAFVVMCRAALRRGRAAAAVLLGLSVALAARSQLLCGLRAEGWLGVVGDVPYRPSSAIGMCAGPDGGVLVAWVTILASLLFGLQDDVSEHGEASRSASAPPALASRGSELSPARL
jgi:hypothetical protein